MSLIKRGRNSWRIQIELPLDPVTGTRRRRYFTVKGNKKAAEAAERKALYELEHGTDVEPDRLTVGQWLQRWLGDSAASAVRPTTLRRYRSIAKRLTALIGDVRLQQLRPAHLQAAYAQLHTDGLSAQTITHYHRLLHNCLRTALRLQLIPTNAAEAVTPPRPAQPDMRALTPDELQTLLGHITDLDFHCLVELAAGTGARIGEALAIRWADVDLDGRRLRIERAMVYTPGQGISYSLPKTDAGRRSISLALVTVESLREHRRRQLESRLRNANVWEDNDLVFCDAVGRPLPSYIVSQRFTRAAKAAGLTHTTFHTLRHTHATLLLRGGVSDKLSAQRLGHANANVTRLIYQHVQPDLADGIADVVDVLLRPAAKL